MYARQCASSTHNTISTSIPEEPRTESSVAGILAPLAGVPALANAPQRCSARPVHKLNQVHLCPPLQSEAARSTANIEQGFHACGRWMRGQPVVKLPFSTRSPVEHARRRHSWCGRNSPAAQVLGTLTNPCVHDARAASAAYAACACVACVAGPWASCGGPCACGACLPGSLAQM